MNQKLIIIILVGVIAGMILGTPVVFVSDVFITGAVIGAFAGVVGHFSMKRSNKEV